MNPAEFLNVLQDLYSRLHARLRAGEAARLLSKPERVNVQSVVGAWFSQYQRSLIEIVGEDLGTVVMDEMMENLLQVASEQCFRRTVIRFVSSAMRHFKDNLLVPASRAYWSRAPERSPAGRDEDVSKRLRKLDAKLADGYEQAVIDIEDPDRMSYRGPAAELREVLTLALHILAPNPAVEATEWYREARRSGARAEPTPTRAERVRFILRSRTQGSAVTESAESYVVLVEDRLGHVINTTFVRGNAATHAGAEQRELVKLLPYINALLRELLPESAAD